MPLTADRPAAYQHAKVAWRVAYDEWEAARRACDSIAHTLAHYALSNLPVPADLRAAYEASIERQGATWGAAEAAWRALEPFVMGNVRALGPRAISPEKQARIN